MTSNNKVHTNVSGLATCAWLRGSYSSWKSVAAGIARKMEPCFEVELWRYTARSGAACNGALLAGDFLSPIPAGHA